MMWRVYSSKTKKTRKIPIHADVAELVKKLLKSAPLGSGKPLCRKAKAEPGRRRTGVVRLLTLKKKLGWDLDPVKSKYSSYTCRHTFVHRMLSGYWNGGVGCSIETLAELEAAGHALIHGTRTEPWGQVIARTTLGINGHHDALRTVFVRGITDHRRVGQCGGVEADLVRPGIEQAAHVIHRAHATTHRQRDEDLRSHGFDDVQDHGAAIAVGGEVQ